MQILGMLFIMFIISSMMVLIISAITEEMPGDIAQWIINSFWE